MTDGPDTKSSDSIKAIEEASKAKAERDLAERGQTQPPDHDPPEMDRREALKAEVESHLATLSHGSAHTVDLIGAVRFILETMKMGL